MDRLDRCFLCFKQSPGGWDRYGAQLGRHVMSTRTGISFLIRTVKNEGGSILKSEHVAGTVPVIFIALPMATFSKATCLYWTA